jgi:hypothetical protein
MSPRPGSIAADVAVPFATPRPPELRAEADFARFVGELGRELRKGRA